MDWIKSNTADGECGDTSAPVTQPPATQPPPPTQPPATQPPASTQPPSSSGDWMAGCGYKKEVSSNKQISGYDSVTGEGGFDQYFDAQQGVFTAPEQGLYEVTVSGRCVVGSKKQLNVHLKNNNQYLQKYFVVSYIGKGSEEISCANTRYFEFNKDDKVTLEKAKGKGSTKMLDMVFC